MCELLNRMHADGSLSTAVPVIGIIKAPLANEEEEAASRKNGWPPSTTGVASFRRDYFNCRHTELYVDEAREVYALLGNRTLQLPWRKVLTRPWAAWRDLQAINARTREKGVVAQSGGEGAALGGICVIGACPRPRTAEPKVRVRVPGCEADRALLCVRRPAGSYRTELRLSRGDWTAHPGQRSRGCDPQSAGRLGR